MNSQPKEREFPSESDSSLRPDWEYCLKFDRMRLWCAVALSMNIDMTQEAVKKYKSHGKEYEKEYRRRRRLAKNSLVSDTTSDVGILCLKDNPNKGGAPTEEVVDMRSFVKWAISKDLNPPDELLRKWGTVSNPQMPETTADALVGNKKNSLTTSEIAFLFNGLRSWDEDQWKKNLGKKSAKWLSNCIAMQGQRGKLQTSWNPVLIAIAMAHKNPDSVKSIRARFQTKSSLSDWKNDWDEYEKTHFPNESELG